MYKRQTQGTLFFDVARIIAEKKPKAFLLENVKNLLSHNKGHTFSVIKDTLQRELGYHITWRVIDGQHFGPLHRERILIVGFREKTGFDWDALQLPQLGTDTPKLKDILHPEDGTETDVDDGKYIDQTGKVHDKYILSDKLWNYLQAYAEKHRAKGNGFGCSVVKPENTSRTLSARYHKDGSETVSYTHLDVYKRQALDSVAQLIDLSGDFERTDGTDKAFQWLNEIEKHDLMSHQQALLDYYRSNAWSNRYMEKKGSVDIWNWEQPELQEQISNLRKDVYKRQGMFNNVSERPHMTNAILRLPQVKDLTGLSRSTIYLMIKQGKRCV